MKTERRGFLSGIVGFVAALFGVKAAGASGKMLAVAKSPDMHWQTASGETPASFAWLKEQLRLFSMSVTFHHVDCGACTCPPGPDSEGFRARITTGKHVHVIVASKQGLRSFGHSIECGTEGDPICAWGNGGGRCTVETWRRIVEGIESMERLAAES